MFQSLSTNQVSSNSVVNVSLCQEAQVSIPLNKSGLIKHSLEEQRWQLVLRDVRFNPSQQIRSHQTLDSEGPHREHVRFNPSQQIRSHQTSILGNSKRIRLWLFQSLSTNQVSSNTSPATSMQPICLCFNPSQQIRSHQTEQNNHYLKRCINVSIPLNKSGLIKLTARSRLAFKM